jgi:hypothetical protein
MHCCSALDMKETFADMGTWYSRLFDVSASYDRQPNGACVPVGEPGPKIPAGSLARLRMVGTMRSYPV